MANIKTGSCSNTLNEIESSSRKAARLLARRNYVPQIWRAFLASLICSPAVITVFLFVPFVGQLLAIMSVLITAFFVYETRSLKVVTGGVLGLIMTPVLLRFFSTFWNYTSISTIYMTLGLSMALTISYLILVGAALFSFYERGFELARKIKVMS